MIPKTWAAGSLRGYGRDLRGLVYRIEISNEFLLSVYSVVEKKRAVMRDREILPATPGWRPKHRGTALE